MKKTHTFRFILKQNDADEVIVWEHFASVSVTCGGGSLFDCVACLCLQAHVVKV